MLAYVTGPEQYRDALEVRGVQAGLLETRQRLEHSSVRAKTQLQQLSERKSTGGTRIYSRPWARIRS